MRRLLLITLLLVLVAGCSSNSGPVIPDEIEDPMQGAVLTNAAQNVQSGRTLWGLYEWVIDLQNETFEAVPLRDAAMHFNVVKDMNESPSLVQFEGVTIDMPNNTISLDVFLYHPYPGRPNLAGFDVHGIMIGPGTLGGFDDSTINMADLTDPHIISPDGLSRWWNPVEFNIGNDLFSYTEGNLGKPHAIWNYDATLNGYKVFSDDLGNVEPVGEYNIDDRLIFTTDATHSRHYDVWFPTEDDHWILRYNYAIDASWAPIPGYTWGDDVDVPDDWDSNANQEEPYWALVNPTQNSLYFNTSEQGGEAKLEVRVFDWQGSLDPGDVADQITELKFEAPGLYDGLEYGTVTDPGSAGASFASYEIVLDGDKLQTGALNNILLTVESANGDYQDGLTGYSGSAPLAYYWYGPVDALNISENPFQAPEALATISDAQVEIGALVEFDATASHDNNGLAGFIETYEWDFDGDGVYGDAYDYGTDILPVVQYNTPGIFEIDLRVTNNFGLLDTLDDKLDLQVDAIPPVAIATADKSEAEVGEAVNFNGSYSHDPDGTVDLWEWDFDDDGVFGDAYDSGTDEMPTFAFSTAGEHFVNLRVTDNDLATDTLDEKIVIDINDPDNEPPVAQATVDNDNPMVGETVTFDGTTSYDPDGTVDIYEWDFDNDGVFGDPYDSGTDDMPLIAFATPGVRFVNLRVTDNLGGIDTLDEKIPINVIETQNEPPVADAIADNYAPGIGDPVGFDGTASFDPDGTVDLYEWDFDNDGVFGDAYDSGTDDMPVTSFATPGIHLVNLQVTDNEGATDTLDELLIIDVQELPNVPPVAIADYSPLTVYEGDPIQFDATSSYDLDGFITLYEWDFDEDGSYGDTYDSGTDEMPVVTYVGPGEYCVGLRVWDDDGAFDVLDEPLCVYVEPLPNIPPVADAYAVNPSVLVFDIVYFDATASYDPDGWLVAWDWDFNNDGIFGDPYPFGTPEQPEYAWTTPGEYWVNLRVTDNDGATDTLGEPIIITVEPSPNIPPVAVAELISTSLFADMPIAFTGSNSYDTDGWITDWLWDFDADGVFGDFYDLGTDVDPAKYFTPGYHEIDLKVIDNGGAEDTLDQLLSFTVYDAISIELWEDQWWKAMNDWSYISRDHVSPAGIPINYLNYNGPWDFTVVTYPDTPDTMVQLTVTHPEVAPFIPAFFPASTDYVMKHGIHSPPYDGNLYFVEEADMLSEILMLHGYYGDNFYTGETDLYQFDSTTGGVIEVQFPLDMSLDLEFYHHFPAVNPIMTMHYTEIALGEGEYDVPYSGPLSGVALYTRTYWELEIQGEPALQALLYKWTDDDGAQVARLYTLNTTEVSNFNTTTYEIFGESRLTVLGD